MHQLTLTTDEIHLLIRHLTKEIEHIDAELVHTDKRELQRDLAEDLKELRAVTDRVVRASELGVGSGAGVSGSDSDIV
jgi:hypothetical protein